MIHKKALAALPEVWPAPFLLEYGNIVNIYKEK